VGVKFFKPILPGLNVAANYLSQAYSFPKWLVARWLLKWNVTELKGILTALNARPAIICRPNRQKLIAPAAETLARILVTQSCRVKVLPEVDAVELIENPPITELEAFHDGLFQIQDPTATAVVGNLSLTAGMKVLDLCAGLGTKSTQLAEVTLDQAEIFATDKIESKLDKLRENARRLGLNSITTIPIESLEGSEFRQFFDVVLLDAPCSATGTIRKSPELKWRLRESELAQFAKLQRELLDSAMKLASQYVVYSTCSLEPEENDAIVAGYERADITPFVPAGARDWVFDGVLRLTPESGADGFTAFVLKV
jgi:16S rRNA (cytosine967-C5)-methyltransferase